MKTIKRLSFQFGLLIIYLVCLSTISPLKGGEVQNDQRESSNLVVSARGGLGVSRITRNSYANTMGWNIGLNGKYYFIRSLGVGSGLDFESRKLGTLPEVLNIADASTKWLDIPVFLAARFGQTHQFIIDLGVLYALPLQGKVGEKGGYGDAIQTAGGLGSISRLGYNYEMTNRWGIGADMTAKYLTPSSFKFYDSTTDRSSSSDQHFIGLAFNLSVSFGATL